MGARETREPSTNVQLRKASTNLRAAKNALQSGGRTRQMVTMHRHRHSNRWKLREEDSILRRRHGSRLYLHASKY